MENKTAKSPLLGTCRRPCPDLRAPWAAAAIITGSAALLFACYDKAALCCPRHGQGLAQLEEAAFIALQEQHTGVNSHSRPFPGVGSGAKEAMRALALFGWCHMCVCFPRRRAGGSCANKSFQLIRLVIGKESLTIPLHTGQVVGGGGESAGETWCGSESAGRLPREGDGGEAGQGH